MRSSSSRQMGVQSARLPRIIQKCAAPPKVRCRQPSCEPDAIMGSMEIERPSALQLMATPSYTVSDVTRYLNTILGLDEALQDLWIRGEVSNLTRAASGHGYFSLK